MDADQAIEKLKSLGYRKVVLGVRPIGAPYLPGDVTEYFGGKRSKKYWVVVDSRARVKSWEMQFKALFPGRRYKAPGRGARFWWCRAEEK